MCPYFPKEDHQARFLFFLLDKVSSRFGNWNNSMFFMVGCITLAKLAFRAITNYVMQTIALPSFVFYEIDKKCRNFVRGEFDSNKKVHTVAYNEMCEAKIFGEFSLKSFRAVNKCSPASQSYSCILF